METDNVFAGNFCPMFHAKIFLSGERATVPCEGADSTFEIGGLQPTKTVLSKIEFYE